MGLVLLSSSSSVYFSLIVFFLTNVVRIPCPYGLGFIKFFVLCVFFLNSFLLFLIRFVIISLFILPDIFDLGFIFIYFFHFLFLAFIIRYFLITFLFYK